MKILENHKLVVAKYTVEHKGEKYMRKVYQDGEVSWTPISYDGEGEDGAGELEKAFQKLINPALLSWSSTLIYFLIAGLI